MNKMLLSDHEIYTIMLIVKSIEFMAMEILTYFKYCSIEILKFNLVILAIEYLLYVIYTIYKELKHEL